MEKTNDVVPGASPGGSEPEKTQTPETPPTPEGGTPPEGGATPPAEGGTPPATPASGSKTPPENLKKALDESRSKGKEKDLKIKEQEDKIKELESATPPSSGDEMSDEGKALKEEIGETKQELANLKDEKTIEGLQTKYPVLKDKVKEFEEFRGKYPKEADPEAVAKLFLTEHDLLGKTQKPKGLEKPSGGGGEAPATQMTAEQVKDLRENNYEKYIKALEDGTIRPDDIK